MTIYNDNTTGVWEISGIHPNDLTVTIHALNKIIQLLKGKKFETDYYQSRANELIVMYEKILDDLSPFPKGIAEDVYEGVLKQL